MTKIVVPMIHVPDVRATVDWYESIGFTVKTTYGDDHDGLSFAILSFGNGEVMFNSGGQPGTADRREVDLYVYTDDVDDLYQRLKDRVDVHSEPNDTFYGMREFMIRDLNRFLITFGQSSLFEVLMTGVFESNLGVVKDVLERGGVKPETLTAALALASSGETENSEISALLKKAGAIPPPTVDAETLRSYVGTYKGDDRTVFEVALKDGELFAAPGSQRRMRLIAIDNTNFKPIFFDDFGQISFSVDAGRTIGCVLTHDDHKMRLHRVEETKQP